MSKNVGRIKLLLIFALFAAPIIASYFVYHFWPPVARKNYGELIPQVLLSDGNRQSGCDIQSTVFRKKWTMVYLGSGACNADCANMIYSMRQIRTAQGAEQDRVERMWIVTDHVQPEQKIVEQYTGTNVLRCTDRKFLDQFSEWEQGAHVYLVDPLGNLMMRFPANPDPSRMIKDIRHLLKVSQIG